MPNSLITGAANLQQPTEYYETKTMVPANGVRDIAYPVNDGGDGFDNLLDSQPRLALDNVTRDAIVRKSDGTKFAELFMQFRGVSQLHSHMQPQPNEQGPRHETQKAWCESRNRKETSTEGYVCARCPAKDSCSWKLELSVITDVGNGPEPFLFTLPAASATRANKQFKNLKERYGVRPTEVVWHVRVIPFNDREKRRAYPIAILRAFSADMQMEYKINDDDAPQMQAPQVTRHLLPQTPPPPPSPASFATRDPRINVGNLPADPFRAQQSQSGVPADTGTAADAVAALAALSMGHSKAQHGDLSPDDRQKLVSRTHASLALTPLRDDNKRHLFVRDHFPDAMEGSLNELAPYNLRALIDWVKRRDAQAYVSGWEKSITPPTPNNDPIPF